MHCTAEKALSSSRIVLTSDSLGKSSQGYSVDKLEDRIKGLCSENDLDADEYLDVPTVEDGSNLW